MRIFLLTLCLVGLGHAVPTPPSNVTDPFISALEDDKPIVSMTWSKDAPSTGTAHIIVCAGTETINATTDKVIAMLKVGEKPTPAEQPYTGLENNLGKDSEGTNCYTINERQTDQRPGHGDVFRVWIEVTKIVKDGENTVTTKYGGMLSSFQKIIEFKDFNEGVSCPNKNIKAVTFGGPPIEALDLDCKFFSYDGTNLKKSNTCILGGTNVTYDNHIACISAETIANEFEYCQDLSSAAHLDTKTYKNVSQGGDPQIESIQYDSKNVILKTDKQLTTGIDYLFSKGSNPLNIEYDKSSPTKIGLTDQIGKSSDLYTLCDSKGTELSTLQDLNVVVEKGTVQGETYWTFSFNNLNSKNYYFAKATDQESLQGTPTGFDETVVDCTNMGNIGTCYGFLVPKTDPAKTYMSLSYSNDDKGSTLSNTIGQTVPGDT